MILEVRHRTTYHYTQPVSISHHMLRLTPRDTETQTQRHSAITVDPSPQVWSPDADFFGNPTHFLTIQQGHTQLVIDASSIVEVSRQRLPEPSRTAPWEEVVARLAADRSEASLMAAQYSFPSPIIPFLTELLAYARPSFPPGRPVLEGARELTHRIFTDFVYEPGATTNATSVAEAFALRRGVCQDFAHIEIACLRALGLPARYVSGYLLTRPPRGKEKLIGADASHAWIAVWAAEQGWVDLDPTNDMMPGEEHITLAWGRDYGDVSPVSGVMFGGGEHTVLVAVDVTPLGEASSIRSTS